MNILITASPGASFSELKVALVRHRRVVAAGIVLVNVAALAGCLVPEKFTAKVEVEPDAGYTFHYSGTVIHACRRRFQVDPPCRSQLDPGMGAGVVAAGC